MIDFRLDDWASVPSRIREFFFNIMSSPSLGPTPFPTVLDALLPRAKLLTGEGRILVGICHSSPYFRGYEWVELSLQSFYTLSSPSAQDQR